MAVTGNPELIAFIREHIRAHGPVSFRWFMEQALYHPGHGYYSSGRATIGRRGDFFTSVSTGALFGRLIGVCFREMWERLGNPHPFTIVEQGAHDGTFARDVLASLDAEFAAAVEYRIVEPFSVLREKQRATLNGFANVRWQESLDSLPAFEGVHFSNELIDAIPVHLVTARNAEWREQFVDWNGERFQFVERPVTIAPPPIPPMDGYATELRPGAAQWLDAVSSRLRRGWILALDYGFEREEFFAPHRIAGTLSAYRAHQRIDDPLANVGEQDLTAHVEFTSLIEHAATLGFACEGFTDQHHFIVGLGARIFPDATAPLTPAEQKERRAFTMLMHPQLMGRAFRVLTLSRGLS